MHLNDGHGNNNGVFVAGDPTTVPPTPGTIVTTDWLNTIQNEISRVVQEAGIELNKADDTQLSQAIAWYVAQSGGAYTHPESHSADMIDETEDRKWLTPDILNNLTKSSNFLPKYIETKSVDGLNSVSFPVAEGRNCFYFHNIRPDGVGAYFYAEFKYQGSTLGGAWKRASPNVMENNPLLLTQFQANSSGTPLEATYIDGSRNDMYYPLGLNGFYCFDYIKNAALTAVKSSQATIPAASFQCDYWGDDRFFGLNGFESPVGTNVDEVVFKFKDYYGNGIDFETGGMIERSSVA